jgi:hypothetical protein
MCVKIDYAALNVNGMDFFELRNAAIAFFRMAVASGSYTQHVVANGMISMVANGMSFRLPLLFSAS